jgi:hypothetical protein
VSLFATLPPDNGAAGLAFDASGTLFVADNGTGQISQIAPNGTVSVFASDIPGAAYLAFGPDPVPEPSSVALVALGVFELIGRRRRWPRGGST